MVSPIGRQASEHLRKTWLLFHRVVGKKIFDRSNLSILGVMRWNLLFEELENGFDELLAMEYPGADVVAQSSTGHPLGHLLLRARAARATVLIRDVRGGEYWLTPRAVGRDWVSGRLVGGAELILLLDAIVGLHVPEQCGDERATLAPISISGLLQIWKTRGEGIGVETRRDNFVGHLGDVSDQGITIRSSRAGKPTTWCIPFRHLVWVEGVSNNGSL